MAVLFAADRANLNFEHGVRLHGLFQQLLGDVKILFQRNRRAVPHVGLERRLFTVLDLLRLMRKQRADPFIQILFGAMVGVQCHRNVRIVCGHLMRECGECERADHTIVDRLSGEICGTAHRHLDDAVGFRLGETLQRSVQRLRAGHIDCGICVAATTCGIQHLGITFRSCDSHVSIMSRFVTLWFSHCGFAGLRRSDRLPARQRRLQLR